MTLPPVIPEHRRKVSTDPYVVAGSLPQDAPLIGAFSTSAAFAGTASVGPALAAQLAIDMGVTGRWVVDPAKIIDNGDGTFSWHPSQGISSKTWNWATAHAPYVDLGYAYQQPNGALVSYPALIFDGDMWAQFSGGLDSFPTFTVIIVAKLMGTNGYSAAGIIESLISGSDPNKASDVFLRQSGDTLRSGVSGVKVIDTITETGRPQILAASHGVTSSLQLLVDNNRSTKWFYHQAINAGYDLNWYLGRYGGQYDPTRTMVMDVLDISIWNGLQSFAQIRRYVDMLNSVYGIV